MMNRKVISLTTFIAFVATAILFFFHLQPQDLDEEPHSSDESYVGGLRLVYSLSFPGLYVSETGEAAERTRRVVRRRLNRMGFSEVRARLTEAGDLQVEIPLPDVPQTDSIRYQVETSGKLCLYIVSEPEETEYSSTTGITVSHQLGHAKQRTRSDIERVEEMWRRYHNERVLWKKNVDAVGAEQAARAPEVPDRIGLPLFEVKPPNYEIVIDEATRAPRVREWLILYNQPGKTVSGEHIEKAWVKRDPSSGNAALVCELDSQGAKDLHTVTQENVRSRLAMVLDGVVRCAPRIAPPPISRGQFTLPMDRIEADAEALANVLSVGMLPAELSLEQKESIRGP